MTQSISAFTRSTGFGNDNNNYHIPLNNVEDSQRVSVDRVAQELESYVDSHKTSLDISVNDNTGDIIVRVISDEDGKVIREIPSEELLDCAAKIEQLAGLLLDENV